MRRSIYVIATIAVACSSCAGLGEAWEKLEAAKKNPGANRLVISGPGSFMAGCQGPFSVEAKTGSGGSLTQTENLSVFLTTSYPNGQFHAGPGCGGIVPFITIPAGSSSGTFYLDVGCGTADSYNITAFGPGLTDAVFVFNFTGSAC